MNWDGIRDWANAPKQIWLRKDDKTVAGTVQIYNDFFWAIVYKAGHLVPTD